MKKGLVQFPNDFELNYLLGNYTRHLAHLKLREASNILDFAVQNTEDAENQVQALTEKGLIQQWLNNFEESEAALLKALSLDHNSEKTYSILATTYKLSGQYLKALKTIERAQEIAPGNQFFEKIAIQIYASSKAVVYASRIRELISESQTKEALKRLMDYFAERNNTEAVNEVTLLLSKLERTNKHLLIGLIDNSYASIEVQKVNYAILNLLNEI